MADTKNDHKLASSIPQFRARTGLGRDVIYEHIRTGKLIARKAGKRTIILEDDARKFLSELPKLKLPSEASEEASRRRKGFPRAPLPPAE